MENQLETNTVMYGKMMAHERWTIYFKMSSTPGCSLEAVPEISLIESIAPLLKARPQKFSITREVLLPSSQANL